MDFLKSTRSPRFSLVSPNDSCLTRRDAETQAFADILNRESPEFITEFTKTNPTIEQAQKASEMRTHMDA